MKVGETVHYDSRDGEVTIEFRDNGSPFADGNGNPKLVLSSNDPPEKLVKAGTFTCRCFIKPANSPVRIGWDPQRSPQSGGNHVVV
jgi:hypothetical protein